MQTQPSKSTILVTGGIGYIGSHTTIELYRNLAANKQTTSKKILIVDNLTNSNEKITERMRTILSEEFPSESSTEFFSFIKGDVLDRASIESIFANAQANNEPIESIIHFAAKKAVRESVEEPLMYYENNFIGTYNLLRVMEKFNCKNLIFSSSACVYGNNGNCKEVDAVTPLNPYGATKACTEYLLRDTANSKKDWSIITLRYFNPAGAHPSGLIGDAPPAFPNNLFPYIEQVAIGKRPHLSVYGSDYSTRDGTGIRDYIHIQDLAEGHIAALKRVEQYRGFNIFNLGTAKGCTVLEIVKAYSKVLGKDLAHKIEPRREGDVDILLANVDKAGRELEWVAKRTLDDICKDSYNWITKNPDGVKD